MTESAGPPRHAALAAAAKTLLDAGDGVLENDVVTRLAAARRAALDTLRPSAFVRTGNWLPTSAAACTLLAVGLFAWSVRVPALPYYDDEQAAFAAQELELLDNIEFVAWMAAEPLAPRDSAGEPSARRGSAGSTRTAIPGAPSGRGFNAMRTREARSMAASLPRRPSPSAPDPSARRGSAGESSAPRGSAGKEPRDAA